MSTEGARVASVSEMVPSWLVQRLEKPTRREGKLAELFKDNPFNFGGGLKNGGLSDAAMDLTRDIWGYDYMGAAEYEWGAVPEALRKMAMAELEAFTIVVPTDEVPEPWRARGDKPSPEYPPEREIHVIAPVGWREEVSERVNGWARDAGPRLRDPAQLIYSLRPQDEWDERRGGWLELDNGFMFFTDRDMFEGACALFEVGR